MPGHVWPWTASRRGSRPRRLGLGLEAASARVILWVLSVQLLLLNKTIRHKGKNQIQQNTMRRMKRQRMAQAMTGAGTNHGGNQGIGITEIGGKSHGIGALTTPLTPGHRKWRNSSRLLCRDAARCRTWGTWTEPSDDSFEEWLLLWESGTGAQEPVAWARAQDQSSWITKLSLVSWRCGRWKRQGWRGWRFCRPQHASTRWDYWWGPHAHGGRRRNSARSFGFDGSRPPDTTWSTFTPRSPDCCFWFLLCWVLFVWFLFTERTFTNRWHASVWALRPFTIFGDAVIPTVILTSFSSARLLFAFLTWSCIISHRISPTCAGYLAWGLSERIGPLFPGQLPPGKLT